MPWLRLWEEMVNIPCIIDPNYCRITQWNEVYIDHALKLQNKCVLCSSLQGWHERPTGMAEQEKGLSLQGRRINPDWQNCSPRCQADPASSKLLLGQGSVEAPHFAFSFCSALCWTLSPLLVCLWPSFCGYYWVTSQKVEMVPLTTRDLPLSLAQKGVFKDLPQQPAWDLKIPSQC